MTDGEFPLLRRCLKFVPVALLTFWLATPSASAQNGQRLRQWWAQRQAARQAEVNGAKGQPNVRGMAGLPPKWVERLQDLPPDQQQRFLQNNEQFQHLPAQRQEQIRRNLERWNKLTPEQKQQARAAEQAFERMTPQQRQYVQNVLLPKWQVMPQERRQVINQHLKMLGNMSPSTQQAALNDPKFVQGLSPDERAMLRELNSLRNPAPVQEAPQP
jgi:Protein of unknown function (DUF3106)